MEIKDQLQLKGKYITYLCLSTHELVQMLVLAIQAQLDQEVK